MFSSYTILNKIHANSYIVNNITKNNMNTGSLFIHVQNIINANIMLYFAIEKSRI